MLSSSLIFDRIKYVMGRGKDMIKMGTDSLKEMSKCY